MESAFPRNIYTSAHDWGQVLMFEGETCSPFRSFTTYLMKRGLRGRYRVSPGPCSTLNRVVPNETWRLWRVLLHAMPCSTLNRVVPNETFQSQVSCIPGSLLAVPSIATSPSATYRLARTSVPTVRFQSLNREQPLCNMTRVVEHPEDGW